MSNKQSSVEWLINELTNLGYIYAPSFGHKIIADKIEQAKAMHREEMDKVAGDFWNEGANYMYNGERKYNSFDDYYNETYGGNK